MLSIPLALAILLGAAGCATVAPSTPAARELLAAPSDPADREYLGLSAETDSFSLADVRADVIVVEILDMYCHNCHKTAPAAKELHARFREGPHADRVRMIGIGTGNSQLEVDAYRKKFQMPFPVLPDPDRTFSRRIGHTETPEFVTLKRDASGALREVYRRPGRLRDAEAMLRRILIHTNL
ncbi:TlpA family protein disulfide reductase, partial [Verrucomicrobiota bacterium]